MWINHGALQVLPQTQLQGEYLSTHISHQQCFAQETTPPSATSYDSTTLFIPKHLSAVPCDQRTGWPILSQGIP